MSSKYMLFLNTPKHSVHLRWNNEKKIESRLKWILRILCFITLFHFSRAGFACLSNPCIFGVCIDGLNSSYSCYCIDGYTGIQCQTNWDECWSNPCENGGTCIDGVAYYNCSCPEGFTGRNCEENVDECLSNPCQNGGICRDKNNGYTCSCKLGYMGTHCEIDVAVCDTDNAARCQNGGECIEGPGLEFTCDCAEGWTGRICQYEINECDSAPCQNGGVCVDKLASYICACPMGYTGINCEEEILICADNPCRNNALCLMEEGVPTCYCVPDYHGEKCEFQYDECQLGPRCMNGGVCIDGVDTFSCSCPPLLTGMLCECLMIGEDSLDCNYTSITIPELFSTTSKTPDINSTLNIRDKINYVTDQSISEVYDSQSSSESSFSSEGSHSLIDTSLPEQTTSMYSDESTEHETMSYDSITPPTLSELPFTSTERPIEKSSTLTTPPTIMNLFTTTKLYPFDLSTLRPHFNMTTTYPAQHTTYDESIPSDHITSTLSYIDQNIYPATQTTPPSSTIWRESTTKLPLFTDYPHLITTTDVGEYTTKSMISTNLEGIPTTQTEYPKRHEVEVTTTSAPAVTYPTTEYTTSHKHHHHHHHHRHHYSPPTTTIETTIDASYTTEDTTELQYEIQTPPDPYSSHTTDVNFIERTTFATDAPKIIPTQMTTVRPRYTTITDSGIIHRTPTIKDSSTKEHSFTTPLIPTGPTSKFNASDLDCIQNGCSNGGTCITTSDGSRCVCRFDRQGPFCDQPVFIKHAAFSGDSFLSHRIYKDVKFADTLDAILPIHIELKVRTRSTNGLILLAAAQGTKGGHYMALFLQKGLLQFQFSCGLQTMLLSELETPVNTGHQISIRTELDFSRNYTHCNASLLVNDTLAMSGDQPTWLKLLPPRQQTPAAILNTWLHLGGAPQAPIGLIIELPPAHSGTGFTGCLHSLYINKAPRQIFADAFDGFGISECGSLACLSSPCRNGAACIKTESNEVDENGDRIEKWKCKCPSGYMGPTCETSVCENNPCQYGGTCVQFPGSGHLCLCPLGKHGHYCEHNLEVALPSFSGSVSGLSSYIAYTVPVPLEYSTELSFKILPQTMSQISLLAFLGQSGIHSEKSDHLAVSFIQGYIMLTWNLGAGPRRIFTQKPIDFRLDAPRVPYEIKIGRIGRQAWLSVDGKFNVTGRSPGSVTRLDVLPVLYIGGHEISDFKTLPHDLPLHSGFQGCIYDVHLKSGQVTVPLHETRGVRGRGVGQCGTRACSRHSCQHEGACLQHGATFTCICQDGWYGPLCAQPMNPCDSFNNKCSTDSICVPLINGYECDCPLGKTGRNCEEDIHSLSDVSLTGRRSYLAVRWPHLFDNNKSSAKRSNFVNYRNFTKKMITPKPAAPSHQHFVMKLLNEVEKQRPFAPDPQAISKAFEDHRRVQFFFIEFQLRPLSERGLLLYFGTLNNNDDKRIGFVSLSLQGGVVEYRISGPNNHVTVVRSVRMLAIGEWHKIKMAQRGRWLTLWVEGSASSALAPSAEVIVDSDALLYIGGLKDLSKLPHNAISGFPVPLRGCVRGLVVSGTRIVLNETNIIESRNIRDCDGTACGGDSCEAGGHCWLDEKLKPHCICPEYAKGERCEYTETCQLISCKNNGRCLRSGRCSCPNGWGGFYCEISMSKPTTPSFRGNSYLVLPPSRIPVKDKRRGMSTYLRNHESLDVALNFSTISEQGLLMWSENDNTKFLGIGLNNGRLKIACNMFEQDNNTLQLPTEFLADGSWHFVRIILNQSSIEVHLDGEKVLYEKFLHSKQRTPSKVSGFLNLYRRGNQPSVTYQDSFYLGGFTNLESVTDRTGGRFERPFKGCVQTIQFGTDANSPISDFSKYQGENIGSCDLHDEEAWSD